MVCCYIKTAACGTLAVRLIEVGANALVAAFAYLVIVGKIERVKLRTV